MRYNYTPIEVAKIQIIVNSRSWWKGGMTEFFQCWWECKWYGQHGRQFKKPNLLYIPAVLLLGTYPSELETYVLTKISTWMFRADLFIIAQTWQQPRCTSIGEWINKFWYSQTMQRYSVLKRNELSSHRKTWKILIAYY